MKNTDRRTDISREELLKKVEKISKDKKIIERFFKSPRFCDEPLLYQYISKIRDTSKISEASDDSGFGSGSSFDPDTAKIKAVFEAVERFCLSIYTKKEITNKPKHKLIYPVQELKSKANIRWIEGYKIVNGEFKKASIPSQLVYVPYDFQNEDIIKSPISTGAACGKTLEDAILSGALEVIERDAYMNHYLSNTCGMLIDFVSDKKLTHIKKYFDKYRLELYLFSLPTNLPFCTILSLLIDRSGIGPAVSAGMKCGFHPDDIILGAIEESWHSRPWMREELMKMPDTESLYKHKKDIVEIRDRGLIWSSVKMIKHLDSWTNNKNIISLKKLNAKYKNNKKTLKFLLETLNNFDCSIYFADLTRQEVEKYGCKVVKVLIPELQPLFLEEPYPYYVEERLKNTFKYLVNKNLDLKNINDEPHFFL